MNKYEVVYIIDTAVEEAPRKELVTRFSDVVTANGGTVEKIDEWGKRRLAYTIDYKNEGYYVLMHVTAPSELPKELERNLQINENILRYLIVKLEEKRRAVKPRPVSVRPAPTFVPAQEAPAFVPAQETPVQPAEVPAPESDQSAEAVIEVLAQSDTAVE